MLVVQVATIGRVEVEKLRPRAIRGRGPVMTAAHARTRLRAFLARFLARDHNRAAVSGDTSGPVDLRVGTGVEQLAVSAVDRIEKPVAVRLHHSLHLAP